MSQINIDYDQECSFCLEKLDNEVAELSCGHRFHFDCLTEWLNNKNIRVCCCICQNETEIVNILNFNNQINQKNQKFITKNKESNTKIVKKQNYCNIL
tara:strand:+ start:1161 stop:1454 length:294 start_codon:yes stop_codon:yes gene_type:complete